MIRTPLKDRARGRWKSIIPMLGLADTKTLSGRHCACPFCGGKDRFRFDDKDGTGTFICSQCGAGDGVEFVKRKLGVEFRGAAEKIESVIGSAPVVALRQKRSERECREALNRLWADSIPVEPGDAVTRFHVSRGIRLGSYPTVLRYCARTRYQNAGGATYHPAMIAMVHAPDGRPATLHRTYLTEIGRKALVDAPRRLMPGELPKGSAVRLAPPGKVLGIAEGIETALAASILFDVPVWAALNAHNMSGWLPPAGVERVIVFGDHDLNFVGQQAAFELAARIHRAGVQANVLIPPQPGDWNDRLLQNSAPL